MSYIPFPLLTLTGGAGDSRLKSLVRTTHSRGVKVLTAVGGNDLVNQ